jgi:predicted nucleic acid-binding protein
MELQAEQLIVDDREGRREAERRAIPVIGTLGVLREAATLRLLDIRVAVERLQTTSFYVAPEVLATLLKDFASSPLPYLTPVKINALLEASTGDRTSA